jgi:hypothetical protein
VTAEARSASGLINTSIHRGVAGRAMFQDCFNSLSKLGAKPLKAVKVDGLHVGTSLK